MGTVLVVLALADDLSTELHGKRIGHLRGRHEERQFGSGAAAYFINGTWCPSRFRPTATSPRRNPSTWSRGYGRAGGQSPTGYRASSASAQSARASTTCRSPPAPAEALRRRTACVIGPRYLAFRKSWQNDRYVSRWLWATLVHFAFSAGR